MKKIKNNNKTKAILIGVFFVYAIFIFTILLSLTRDIKKVNEELPQPNYQVLAQNWEEKYNVLWNIHFETLERFKQENEMLRKENEKLLNQINNEIEETSLTFENSTKNTLPDTPTDMYFSMDYRKLTCETSYQYMLQQCENLYIGEYGIQRYVDKNKEYLLVALGENYGTDIGDTWKVTLENGSEFNIMLGDCKADMWYGHPCINYNNEYCLNVIEFIVDMDYVPKEVLASGTMSSLEYFNGNIQSIEYTGRLWSPDI